MIIGIYRQYFKQDDIHCQYIHNFIVHLVVLKFSLSVMCVGKVRDSLCCLYKNGSMITPKRERVVCFVLI